MSEELIVVCPDIECEACANSIKRSLGKLAGVGDVQVDVPSKRVSILYSKESASPEILRSRLELAGFRAE